MSVSASARLAGGAPYCMRGRPSSCLLLPRLITPVRPGTGSALPASSRCPGALRAPRLGTRGQPGLPRPLPTWAAGPRANPPATACRRQRPSFWVPKSSASGTHRGRDPLSRSCSAGGGARWASGSGIRLPRPPGGGPGIWAGRSPCTRGVPVPQRVPSGWTPRRPCEGGAS